MKKKTIHSIIPMLLLVGLLMSGLVTAHAAQAVLRYTGISELTATLSMSSAGGAKCKGSAEVRSGYTVDLTVELKQDGYTIKTWTNSGTGTVSASGTYYVMSGHEYVVTTTAEVKDSNGRIIETPSKDSLVSSY